MYDFSLLDKHIEEQINNTIFGASVMIIKDNKVMFSKCYGLANKEKNYPITPNSVFRLASNTKIVTATAAVLAESMGLLNLDEYVDEYLPEFKELYVKDKDGNILDTQSYRITIRQMLDHSSGFGTEPHEPIIYNSLSLEERKDLETSVNNYVKTHALAFKPGTNRYYSALICFDVIARIIEIVSGLKYDVFLKKYVFEPLDMSHTAYSYKNVKEEDIVKSTARDEKGNLIQFEENGHTFDNFVIGYTGGGAGLISTVEDYSHLMEMLTNKGIYKGKIILNKEAWNRFTEKRRVDYPTGGYDYWGCGVQYHKEEDNRLPEDAFCWSGAYGTHAWSDPKNKITVVYMHNTIIPYEGGAGVKHIITLERDVRKVFGI